MLHYAIALISLGVFAGILALMESGRRVGIRVRERANESKTSFVALEGAVFGLMGLLFAFSFASAAARWETRRQLVVEEANAIGTAWLRLDLLPPERQPSLRDNFRSYLDSRLAYYRGITDEVARQKAALEADAVQREIWSRALVACRESPAVTTPNIVVPALNAMFDIRTTRTVAANTHLPGEIGLLLIISPLISSFMAGFNLATSVNRNWTHMLAFAAILSFTVYVIFDLEYPRVGFIRLDQFDQILVDLRNSMQGS